MPVNGNVAVTRSVLPDGIAGVNATVKKMVELAHGIYGSKSAKVRALAIDIVKNAGIPDKDYYGEIVAIHNWVRDNIRYFHDPIGQETLSYPEEMLFNSRGGDCDDMVITEIGLLGSIGVEAYPVVVGMFPNHYSHVYLYAKVPEGKGRNAGQIIPLDPIMKDWPAGREATGLKAKKAYPQFSNPLTMNGLPMTPQRKRLIGMRNGKASNPVAGMDVGDLGAYAIAPSYLDTEDSHADELCVPDGGSSLTSQKTVANGTQVDMPFEGIDGMFGGLGAGDAFNATSAGDAGTIVQSGGQLVPKGFIRNGPDLNEVMAMTPATADQLGPRGPIFARKAGLNRDYLPGSSDPKLASLARQLQSDPSVKASIIQTVGQKQYTLPSVQAALNAQQGLSPKAVAMSKQTVVALNSIPLDRIGAAAKPLGSLGEQLADAEAELAKTAPAARAALAKAAQPQALHYAEGWKKAGRDLNARVKALEDKILKLRQILRDKGIADPTANRIRAAAVSAGQSGLAGMGRRVATLSDRRIGAPRDQRVARVQDQSLARRPDARLDARGPRSMPMGTIMDTIKQPIVWGPALAFVGVLAFMYLKKRRAAAATA